MRPTCSPPSEDKFAKSGFFLRSYDGIIEKVRSVLSCSPGEHLEELQSSDKYNVVIELSAISKKCLN